MVSNCPELPISTDALGGIQKVCHSPRGGGGVGQKPDQVWQDSGFKEYIYCTKVTILKITQRVNRFL